VKLKSKPIKWSPKIAYAVGLLTTDGNLSPDGRHMILVSKDIPQLETFKKCLNLKNKIGLRRSGYTGKKNCYCVQFGDVALYKWLLKKGLSPNKTKRIGSLKIPHKYFFDFLRGHLDGDGCIRKYQDPIYKNSRRFYINFHAFSLKHLRWIRKTVKKILKINGYIRDGARVSILTYAKKESLKLISRLYYNNKVPCLRRKYRIAQPLLIK
jgi:hypothetical protein